MLSMIAEIIRDLLIFVFAIAALLIALVVIVSYHARNQPVEAHTDRAKLSAFGHTRGGRRRYPVGAYPGRRRAL
jgi:hypothetical protein